MRFHDCRAGHPEIGGKGADGIGHQVDELIGDRDTCLERRLLVDDVTCIDAWLQTPVVGDGISCRTIDGIDGQTGHFIIDQFVERTGMYEIGSANTYIETPECSHVEFVLEVDGRFMRILLVQRIRAEFHPATRTLCTIRCEGVVDIIHAVLEGVVGVEVVVEIGLEVPVADTTVQFEIELIECAAHFKVVVVENGRHVHEHSVAKQVIPSQGTGGISPGYFHVEIVVG